MSGAKRSRASVTPAVGSTHRNRRRARSTTVHAARRIAHQTLAEHSTGRGFESLALHCTRAIRKSNYTLHNSTTSVQQGCLSRCCGKHCRSFASSDPFHPLQPSLHPPAKGSRNCHFLDSAFVRLKQTLCIAAHAAAAVASASPSRLPSAAAFALSMVAAAFC